MFPWVTTDSDNVWPQLFSNTSKWCGFQKHKYPFCKANNNQLTLSYIGQTFLDKSPNMLKDINNLNTFKYNLKKYFLEPNLKIKKTLFEFIFIFNFNHPHFYLLILILNNRIQWHWMTLTNHNLNTSFYKHVFCHLANNICFFLLCQYWLGHEYFFKFLTNPIYEFHIFHFGYCIVTFFTGK